MSIKFSKVDLKSEDNAKSILVSGEPKCFSDLVDWTQFREFADQVKPDERIFAHVETYVYGGGTAIDASPEEVAYMYMRLDISPDFLESRTEKVREYSIDIIIDDC